VYCYVLSFDEKAVFDGETSVVSGVEADGEVCNPLVFRAHVYWLDVFRERNRTLCYCVT
jgi:hypothetical protein